MSQNIHETEADIARREHTAQYSAGVDALRRRLRRPIDRGPGRRPDERERAEANRKAREAAAQAEKAEKREQAATTRQAALDRSAALKHTKVQLDTKIGNTRGQMRLAADRLDIDAAQELAAQVVALELVRTELLRIGSEFTKQHRGSSYYTIDAGRV